MRNIDISDLELLFFFLKFAEGLLLRKCVVTCKFRKFYVRILT